MKKVRRQRNSLEGPEDLGADVGDASNVQDNVAQRSGQEALGSQSPPGRDRDEFLLVENGQSGQSETGVKAGSRSVLLFGNRLLHPGLDVCHDRA